MKWFWTFDLQTWMSIKCFNLSQRRPYENGLYERNRTMYAQTSSMSTVYLFQDNKIKRRSLIHKYTQILNWHIQLYITPPRWVVRGRGKLSLAFSTSIPQKLTEKLTGLNASLSQLGPRPPHCTGAVGSDQLQHLHHHQTEDWMLPVLLFTQLHCIMLGVSISWQKISAQ